ncbi:hypothetical protein [Dyella acidiphila]|uniref:DUF2884 family protein n=1 Tax=Dyella acidiphila TaxID=2775866 RepID=A0ABR9GB17_9GAMM|nr:hypothetical protein [Dyella acidiphila]MBE1161209.1 hypothetical protein [Dyella acidiphila]
MNHARLFGTLALCGLLAACNHDSGHSIDFGAGIHLFHGSIRTGDGQITLRASHAPDAIIDADGDLRIDQQAVTVDPAVRELLKSYYQHAMTVETDGIDTGKAGAAVGKQALQSVVSSLSGGNSGQIKQQVEAKAQQVKLAALKLCNDLGGIQSAQDQLVTQLPAFQPYGHIVSNDDVNDCKNGIHVN